VHLAEIMVLTRSLNWTLLQKTVQYITVQYITIPYITVQYITVPYITVLCSWVYPGCTWRRAWC